jgi:cytochrome c oxidase subunit 4
MERTYPSKPTLLASYLALLALLAATAWASRLSTPWLSVTLSLGIAALKAGVILLFFMHLRYRSLRVVTVALASTLWLLFLFGITLADYLTRGSIGVPGR